MQKDCVHKAPQVRWYYFQVFEKVISDSANQRQALTYL